MNALQENFQLCGNCQHKVNIVAYHIQRDRLRWESAPGKVAEALLWKCPHCNFWNNGISE